MLDIFCSIPNTLSCWYRFVAPIKSFASRDPSLSPDLCRSQTFLKEGQQHSSQLFNSSQVDTYMLSYYPQSTFCQEGPPAWTTHTRCQKQSLIHPHVGPGIGPQSPIEASSLVLVSPFGAFHVLPRDKTPSGPFQTMKEERQRSRPFSSQKFLWFLRIFTHLLPRNSSVLYQVLGESFCQNLK